MPKKIRELKNLLLQSGFTCRTGKGSHTNWYHPLLSGRVTILYQVKTEKMRKNTKRKMLVTLSKK
ncbi:MAG: hypothetical protein RLZZ184_1388 [Cyanobacteriota bacterium]|jgi:predicted RNA binding protein YcfA (HicA-like mRNA interferase family)